MKKSIGVFISHLQKSCNQIGPEIAGQMISQNFNQFSCTIRGAGGGGGGGGNSVFVFVTEGTGMKRFWQLPVLGVLQVHFPAPDNT